MNEQELTEMEELTEKAESCGMSIEEYIEDMEYRSLSEEW